MKKLIALTLMFILCVNQSILFAQQPAPPPPSAETAQKTQADLDAIIELMGELQQEQIRLRQYIEQEAAKLHAENAQAGGAIEQLPKKSNWLANLTKWAGIAGAIYAAFQAAQQQGSN